jgi:hypothetical protein
VSIVAELRIDLVAVGCEEHKCALVNASPETPARHIFRVQSAPVKEVLETTAVLKIVNLDFYFLEMFESATIVLFSQFDCAVVKLVEMDAAKKYK